jgi:hypothetical protein
LSRPDLKPITEVQLRGWKLLEKFLGVLDQVACAIPPQRREVHGLRDLDRRAYFGMFLFGLFNAVTDSMRALCSATQLPHVQRLLRIEGPVAISGFSDAQHVFAPEILEPVLSELLGKSLARNLPNAKIGRISPEVIRVLDSTLWKVIPRMQWAQWRHQHVEQRAVRLHIKLRLADVQPVESEISEGRICERAAMRRMLKPGEFYIGDRNYGTDHSVFAELEEMGCGYVLRLNNTTILEEVVEAYPLSPEAVAQGITSDALVRIGTRGRGGVRRVIRFQRPAMKEEVILVTSEPHGELSAVEVIELYRHRWQVEMFFRWLKCLVPCRHWFAESREGVRIQIYLSLIQALLLAEVTGRKPNKRMMELLRWHQLGWASDEELGALLIKEEAARTRRAAKTKA